MTEEAAKPQETCIGILDPRYGVGDERMFSFAAPGVGHITYRITRIDDKGNAWGIVLEDTGWIPEPESFQ